MASIKTAAALRGVEQPGKCPTEKTCKKKKERERQREKSAGS